MKVETEAIREALLAIADAHNGVLNPRAIVDAARQPSHPLHPYFEWEDPAAGDLYRLAQAASLIRRVRLTVVRQQTAARELRITTTRAFQSRPSMRTAEGGYERIDHVLADPEKRRELLAQVLTELTAYRRRWAELSELEPVWIAVDEAAIDHTGASSSTSAPVDESRQGATG